jgi:hypothetical protein
VMRPPQQPENTTRTAWYTWPTPPDALIPRTQFTNQIKRLGRKILTDSNFERAPRVVR